MDFATTKKLFREVRIMKMLAHPHIVRMYEVIDTPKELFLVLEYAPGGEIFDFLVARGRLKEQDARKYFRQIISAVDYCHKVRIIHRDLKAENMLLDSSMNVKVADFGFSNQFSPQQRLNTWCGSPPYAAPELFQGKEYIGPEVDIWSLGVVLYVLVCGSLPFDGSNLQKLRARVLAGKYKIPFYMSPECEKLLKKILVLDPQKRSKMDDIKKDHWFNTDFENEPIINSTIDHDLSRLTPDEEKQVFQECLDIGIDKQQLEASLKQNLYDHISATYYVLRSRICIKKVLDSQPKVEERQRSSTEPEKILEIPERQHSTDCIESAVQLISAKKRESIIPANMDLTLEPRELRFSFSIATSSPKNATEIINEIQRVLKMTNVQYNLVNPFLVSCVAEEVDYEVEVCRLPRLSLNGIRIKRLQGNTWTYKNICERFLAQLCI